MDNAKIVNAVSRQPQTSRSKNLFNKDTVTRDAFIRYFSGEVAHSSAGNFATDFIPVEPETYYVIKNGRNAQNAGTSFYDKDKAIISGVQTASFMTPEDCYFIRTTVNISDYLTAQVEKGKVSTSYEAYRTVDTLKRLQSAKI